MSEESKAVANLIERIAQLARSDAQGSDLHPAQWAALRYLSQANRFSRNPVALTRYLNATRGTTSQTLIALDQKGYVRRIPSTRDKRSVDLELTAAGEEKVAHDPLARLGAAIDGALGDGSAQVRDALASVLLDLIGQNEGRAFGQCQTCRHFRRNEAVGNEGPHRCGLLNVGLSDVDGTKICVEHEPMRGNAAG